MKRTPLSFISQLALFSCAGVYPLTLARKITHIVVSYAVNLLCSRHIGADGTGGSNAESTIGLLTMAGAWCGLGPYMLMLACARNILRIPV